MKQSNLLKILLVIVAIVGLAIGMSAVTGYNNSSDKVNTAVSSDNNALMDSKCGTGETNAVVAGDTETDAKCGGDNAKDTINVKADGAKCGGDNAKDTVNVKVDGAKCGGDNAKDTVNVKVDGAKCGGDNAKDTAKDTVNIKADDAKCGVGKCG